jgi:hypothetical protein
MFRLRFIPQQLNGELMKHWKLIVSAVVIAALANMSFAEDNKSSFPKTWEAQGNNLANYKISLENDVSQTKNSKILSLQSMDNVKDSDFVALTKLVDVSQLRGRGGMLSLRFKELGYSTQKDLWLRFFDDENEIIHMDIEPVGEYDPKKRHSFRNAVAFFKIPQGATKMEVGFAWRGEGSLQISELEFHLGKEKSLNVSRVPITKLINIKGVTSSIDELNQTLKR